MMKTYTISTREINGYTIEYADIGFIGNPVLIFAHGLGGNLRQWNYQFDCFKKDFRIIAYSLQGHGNSSLEKTKGSYTIERYGDVAISLLEELDITLCTWIGNSMGGVIGYELLKRRPELIQRIITNGTAPELRYSNSALKVIRMVDRMLVGLLGYERYIGIAVNASLKDIEKREVLKKLFLSSNPLTIIESHQTLGNYSYIETIEKSETPIIFIRTPRDKDINKAINRLQVRLSSMSNVSFVEKKDGGHIYNIELPEAYNLTLKKILTQKID